MEAFKKFGEFAKLHYEKILLAVMLLGLAGTVLFLYGASQEEAEKIRAFFRDVEQKGHRPKLVPPVDLTRFEGAVKVAANPVTLNFTPPHNLLNPVKWQKTADGNLIKLKTGNEILDMVAIQKITPLQFVLAITQTNQSGYFLNITNEAALPPYPKRLNPQFFKQNMTNTFLVGTNPVALILREVRGADENLELIIEFKDTGERVSVTKPKPFIRVDNFEVDLFSTIDKKPLTKKRVGDTVRIAGENYKIVAINPTEVVLSAGNDKKHTIRQQVSANM